MRNAASAKAAISVPRPASFPVTAYSLTIAYELHRALQASCKDDSRGIICKASTLGPLRAVLSNILDLENISPDEV